MDFKSIKENAVKNAIKFKNKAIDFKNKAIDLSVEKVSKSSLVIKNQTELDDLILKSENKINKNQEGEEKTFIKRVFVIFGDSKQNFFKEFLVSFPILLAKVFSQNVSFKVVDISNIQIDYSKFNLKEFPAMIIFENKEIYKIIYGEENLKKVVKSLTLDINKTVDEL
ncbi:MAG: hypothetical protein PHE25_01485 [Candidatus Gracilibacteria bacterium]|nr:hypothetical protein [Candidatus Gracilibacteria bacterium]